MITVCGVALAVEERAGSGNNAEEKIPINQTRFRSVESTKAMIAFEYTKAMTSLEYTKAMFALSTRKR
jgi:hypothetical protein